MDKMNMKCASITETNIKKIKELFPNCVIESEQNGKLAFGIDFESLKLELSDALVDDKAEKYQMTWPGKKRAILLSGQGTSSTLRPIIEKSVDFTKTKNIYIEGDNLEALKVLRETYFNKIKMIYIDPPYNTGNDFLYDDNFASAEKEYIDDSGQIDEFGNRMVANFDSNGRFHSDWLSMMFSRLKVAKDLLTNDGVIFISIDDNEYSNLKKICDEIFNEKNFVAQIAVQLNPRGRNLDVFVAKTFESVLVYVKDYNNLDSIIGVDKEGRMVEEYDKEDSNGKYRLIGLRNRNQAFNPETRPNLYYPLYVNPDDCSVSTIKDDLHYDEVWPDTSEGIKTCWTWMKAKVDKENELVIAGKSGTEWRIYRKDYLFKDGEIAKTLVKTIWTDNTINNDYGKKAIKDLFGSNVMSFPKSPDLIKKLIQIGCGKDGIVLDFFSGSATTAESVMRYNLEDGGNRRFIMIQLPELCDSKSEAKKAGLSTICDLGEERIRRAGKKIKEEAGILADNLDVGFRVLKLDSSNMQDVYYNPNEVTVSILDSTVDNIKIDRTALDLLFQVMLDLGLELSSDIVEKTIAGKKYYIVNENDLIACFDDELTNETIVEIAKQQPLYAVFKNKSFTTDSVGINNEQIFKTYSPATVVKVL